MPHFALPVLFGLLVAAGTAIAQPAQRHFDIRGFNAVDLASSDTIHIVPGNTASVTAEGDPRAVTSLALTVRDGVLRVGRTPGRHRDRGAVITVSLPMVRAMSLSGSGMIEAVGIGGETVTTRLSGSGRIALTNVHSRHVRLILDGSGSIIVSGRTDRVEIDMDGSGHIKASELATSALAIDARGSGDILAATTGAANIHAAGSGNVRVTGRPACAVRIGGSGRVTCG